MSLSLEQYRPQVAAQLWAEARDTVKVAPEVAAVMGNNPPSTFRDDPTTTEFYGPQWLERKAETFLFFVNEWGEVMQRERHRRYFRWDTEPMIGCWVWVDDGPRIRQRLTIDEAEKWTARLAGQEGESR